MKINTLHGQLNTPVFMPDATYGAIKSVSFDDVEKSGIPAVVTTTLHIEQKLGSEYVANYGGLHKLWNWNKPVITDSGGYQVFSLIHAQKNKHNKITEAGCSFVDHQTGKYNFISPEISQIIQHRLGSDIRVVLDEMTPGETTHDTEKVSVSRTTRWAKRSKDKFMELEKLEDLNSGTNRPLLCCVIQGGNNFELRKQSAEELMEIGFDFYGFGGAPLLKKITWKDDDRSGKFFHDLLSYTAELLPKDKPKYALGVGTPDDIVYCIENGWDLFDTVLPTRNARHGVIYSFPGVGDQEFSNYSVLHIRSNRYSLDSKPIDDNCACECCRTTSRAYLRHLLRINEPVGFRLASIHNLYFYNELVKKYQK